MSAYSNYIQDLNDAADAEREAAEQRAEQEEREMEDAGFHRDADGDWVDQNGSLVEDPDYEDDGRFPDGSTDDEPGEGYR